MSFLDHVRVSHGEATHLASQSKAHEMKTNLRGELRSDFFESRQLRTQFNVLHIEKQIKYGLCRASIRDHLILI